MILGIFILILLMYVGIKIAYHTGKFLFVFLDIAIVFFVAYFIFLNKIGKNISEAPASYLWSFIVAFFAVGLYLYIVYIVTKKIPIISLILHFINSFIVVYVVMSLILDAYKTKLYSLSKYVEFYVIPLFKNEPANIVANIIVYGIFIAIILQARIKAFDEILEIDTIDILGDGVLLKKVNKKTNTYKHRETEPESKNKEYEKQEKEDKKENSEYEKEMNEIERDEKFIFRYHEACDTLNIQDYLNPDKEVIKKNYRELAKKYHPDVNKDSIAKDLFKKVNSAKDFLTDTNIEYYAYLDSKY
ncbi:hypothetical protein FL857_10900 [Criibacterium bergeronii]|uniref:J domain-containing protein n=1 Tax=Criibacterium bergeronii TaxID=1871336 RepID=A0A552UXM4_9FIRM|nr:DnaJ domain-containing protein [Criibacterium bergeronii]TRW22910.1 hypothetical protein FL857_10900 [Criibacterium bergeronii]